MIESLRMRPTGQIACVGSRGIHTRFWWETRKGNVGGRIILKWILEKEDGIVWIELIWLRIRTNGGLL
jgi:hypothetical protein